MRTDNRSKHAAATMLRARDEARNLIPTADVRKHWKKLYTRGLVEVFVVRTCDGYRIRFKVRKGSVSQSAGHFNSSVILDDFAEAMQHAAAELHESTMKVAA